MRKSPFFIFLIGGLASFSVGMAQDLNTYRNDLHGKIVQNDLLRANDFRELLTRIEMPIPLEIIVNSLIITSNKLGRGPVEKSFTLRGKATVYSKDVDVIIIIAQNKEKKDLLDISLAIKLPKKWKLSDAFKNITLFDRLPFFQAWFIVSTLEYDSQVLGVPVKKGCNFFAQTDFSKLKSNAPVNDISGIIGQRVNNIIIHGLLPRNESQSVFMLVIPTPLIRQLSITNFINVDAVSMPETMAKTLKKLQLFKPAFILKTISLAQELDVMGGDSLQVTAPGILYGSEVMTTVVIKKQVGISQVHSTISAPTGWKFSTSFPLLKKWDSVPLKDPIFVLATHPYFNKEKNVNLSKGFHVVSDIASIDTLKNVSTFVANVLGPFGFDQRQIKLIAPIPKNERGSTLDLLMPIRWSLDSGQLLKDRIIKNPSEIIKSISTTNFKASFSPQLQGDIETQVTLEIVGRKDPISLSGVVVVNGRESVLRATTNRVEDAFDVSWLQLDQFELDVHFNYQLLKKTAGQGVPLPASLNFKGTMNVTDVPITLSGQSVLTGEGISDIVLNGSSDGFSLTQMNSLLATLFKEAVSLDALPKMLFSDMKITIIPKDAIINGKKYKNSFIGTGYADLDGIKGTTDFIIDATEKNMKCTIQIPSIETQNIKLTGPGPDNLYGTKDDCPVIQCDISPQQQQMRIIGQLSIPSLQLKQRSGMVLLPKNVEVAVSTTIFNQFNVDGTIVFSLKKPEDFTATLSLGTLFFDFVRQGIVKQLNEYKDGQKELASLLLKKIADGLFTVKKATLHVNGKDRATVLMPTVSLTVQVKNSVIDLDSISFDIKKRSEFFKKVTQQLLESLKK